MVTMKAKQYIKNSLIVRRIAYFLRKIQIDIIGERTWVSHVFKVEMGADINLDNPVTLNEKTVWLKINYIQDNYLYCCDKYLIHEYLKQRLGHDYAPKLLFVTKNIKDLSLKKIEKFPCIIKVSNGSGSNLIVNSKTQYSDKYLQQYFKKQILISNMHTLVSREHQYLKKAPYLVIEELLQDSNGGIPNDYKILYINGKLQFVYCSVDRLGANVRQIYDKDWNRLHFIWVKGANEELFEKYEKSASIDRPLTFNQMLILSETLAQDFPLVRIDFYEVGEKLYIGEITLHHGSGSDKFYPEEFDEYYGRKLQLPKANR